MASSNEHLRALIERYNPGVRYRDIADRAGVGNHILYDFVNLKQERIPTVSRIQEMARIISCPPTELFYALAHDRYPEYTAVLPMLDRMREALVKLPEDEWATVTQLLEQTANLSREQRIWLYGFVQGAIGRLGVEGPLGSVSDTPAS